MSTQRKYSSQRKQRGLLMILGMLVWTLIALGLLAGGWFAFTESGFRWLSKTVEQMVPEGRLSLSDPSGSLFDRLSWGAVAWTDGADRYEAKRVSARIDWSALLRFELHFEELHVDVVRLQLGESSDTPLTLPEQIRSPLPVRVDSLKASSVQWTEGSSDQTPRWDINNLEGAVSWVESRFEISQMTGVISGAAFQLRAQSDFTGQYPVHLGLQLERGYEGGVMNGDVTLQGSVRGSLMLNARAAETNGGNRKAVLDAEAELVPMGVVFWRNAKVAVNGLDLNRWFDEAPTSLFNGELALNSQGQSTSAKGSLRLTNDVAGAWPKNRIPLTSLHVNFTVDTGGDGEPGQYSIEVNRIEARLRAGAQSSKRLRSDSISEGTLTGTVAWSGQGQVIQGGQINLRGQQLRGNWFDERLEATPIDFDLSMGLKPGRSDANEMLSSKGELRLISSLELNQFAARSIALNGRVRWDGMIDPTTWRRLPPTLVGDVHVDLTGTRVAGKPLQALIHLKFQPKDVINVDAQASLMSANLKVASGRSLKNDDTINVSISVKDLQDFSPWAGEKLAGAAHLTAQIKPSLNAPELGLAWDLNSVAWGREFTVARVEGEALLGLLGNSPLQLKATVHNVHRPEQASPFLKQLNVNVAGTNLSHQITVHADAGQSPFSGRRPMVVDWAAVGGVSGLVPHQTLPSLRNLGWIGQLNSLSISGVWSPHRTVKLKQAALVKLAGGQFQLSKAWLGAEDQSEIFLEQLRWSGSAFSTKGESKGLALPRMSSLLRTSPTVDVDQLKVQLKWNVLSEKDRLEGDVQLGHLSGGLQILGDSQLSIPVSRLKAQVRFNRNEIAGDIDFKADGFGEAQSAWVLPVVQDPKTRRWSPHEGGGLSASLGANVNNMEWLGPLIHSSVRTGGNGQVAVAVSGTLSSPKVQGILFWRDASLVQLDQNLRLESGDVNVAFTEGFAKVEKAEFLVYNRQVPRRRIEELGPLIQGAGVVRGAGQWTFNDQGGEVMLQAERAALIQRADRWAMLDGSIRIRQAAGAGALLKVDGDARLLGAYFEQLEDEAASLGDDVKIRGQAAGSAEQSTPVDARLKVDLGDLCFVHAEGVRTRLDGAVQLTVQEGVVGGAVRRSARRIVANGTIKAIDGTYRAYGQDLTIDRGVINFQGALDNPGLNIRAVRKGVAVEAGVEITGSARRPKVTLVSEPAVPDSEKLSWMIIGRGSNSTDRDSTLLLTAAAAILGDSEESKAKQVAKMLGIDDLSLSTGSLTAADSRAVGSKVALAPGADASAKAVVEDDPLLSQRIVSLGKRLSQKMVVSIEQSLTTAAGIVKLNYQVNRRLSVIARAGADNAVDLLYQFSFD